MTDDVKKDEIEIPATILESRPKGVSEQDWAARVTQGEQFRRMEGGHAKAELAYKMMDQGVPKGRG